MSRSGYTEDCDDQLTYGRWRAQVISAIQGRRGQAFLRELAVAMDAMPQKALIKNTLVSESGECCTIGVVCKSRGIDVSSVDPECTHSVAELIDIARPMTAEIEFENDECGVCNETPEQRWTRMRQWVDSCINSTTPQ